MKTWNVIMAGLLYLAVIGGTYQYDVYATSRKIKGGGGM